MTPSRRGEFDPRLYQIATLGALLLYGWTRLDFDITPPRAATAGRQRPCDAMDRHPAVGPDAFRSAQRTHLRPVALAAVPDQRTVACGRRGASSRWEQVRGAHWRQAPVQPHQPRRRRAAPGERPRVGLARPVGQPRVVRLSDGVRWRPGRHAGGARGRHAGVPGRRWVLLVGGRSWWLGEPMAIPLHRLQSGALLLFAFFMISDPRRRPIRASAGCCSRRSWRRAPGTCSSGCSGRTGCCGRSRRAPVLFPPRSMVCPVRLSPGRPSQVASAKDDPMRRSSSPCC